MASKNGAANGTSWGQSVVKWGQGLVKSNRDRATSPTASNTSSSAVEAAVPHWRALPRAAGVPPAPVAGQQEVLTDSSSFDNSSRLFSPAQPPVQGQRPKSLSLTGTVRTTTTDSNSSNNTRGNRPFQVPPPAGGPAIRQTAPTGGPSEPAAVAASSLPQHRARANTAQPTAAIINRSKVMPGTPSNQQHTNNNNMMTAKNVDLLVNSSPSKIEDTPLSMLADTSDHQQHPNSTPPHQAIGSQQLTGSRDDVASVASSTSRSEVQLIQEANELRREIDLQKRQLQEMQSLMGRNDAEFVKRENELLAVLGNVQGEDPGSPSKGQLNPHLAGRPPTRLERELEEQLWRVSNELDQLEKEEELCGAALSNLTDAVAIGERTIDVAKNTLLDCFPCLRQLSQMVTELRAVAAKAALEHQDEIGPLTDPHGYPIPLLKGADAGPLELDLPDPDALANLKLPDTFTAVGAALTAVLERLNVRHGEVQRYTEEAVKSIASHTESAQQKLDEQALVLDEAHHTLAALDMERNAVREDTAQLEFTITKREQRIKEAMAAAKEANQYHQKITADINTANQEAADLQSKILELQRELDACGQEEQNQALAAQTHRQRLEAVDARRKKAAEEEAQLHEETVVLDQKARALQAKLADLQRAVSDSRAARDDAVDKASASNSRVAQLQDEVTGLQMTLRRVERGTEGSQQASNDTARRIASLNSEIEEVSQQADSTDKEVRSLQDSVRQLRQQTEAHSAKRKDTYAQLAVIESILCDRKENEKEAKNRLNNKKSSYDGGPEMEDEQAKENQIRGMIERPSSESGADEGTHSSKSSSAAAKQQPPSQPLKGEKTSSGAGTVRAVADAPHLQASPPQTAPLLKRSRWGGSQERGSSVDTAGSNAVPPNSNDNSDAQQQPPASTAGGVAAKEAPPRVFSVTSPSKAPLVVAMQPRVYRGDEARLIGAQQQHRGAAAAHLLSRAANSNLQQQHQQQFNNHPQQQFMQQGQAISVPLPSASSGGLHRSAPHQAPVPQQHHHQQHQLPLAFSTSTPNQVQSAASSTAGDIPPMLPQPGRGPSRRPLAVQTDMTDLMASYPPRAVVQPAQTQTSRQPSSSSSLVNLNHNNPHSLHHHHHHHVQEGNRAGDHGGMLQQAGSSTSAPPALLTDEDPIQPSSHSNNTANLNHQHHFAVVLPTTASGGGGVPFPSSQKNIPLSGPAAFRQASLVSADQQQTAAAAATNQTSGGGIWNVPRPGSTYSLPSVPDSSLPRGPSVVSSSAGNMSNPGGAGSNSYVPSSGMEAIQSRLQEVLARRQARGFGSA